MLAPEDARERVHRKRQSMARHSIRPTLGIVFYFAFTFVLGSYFTYASVQGDFGILKRIEIDAEVERLTAELDAVETEVATYANLTRRLSDAYLDLDLLDEQAREVLGLVRADEVILR